MNIKETVLNLQKVFDEMTEAFSGFQKETGLACLSGCGKCCLFPELETSVLECLPMALKVHQDGTLEDWITKLESADHVCVMWKGDRATGAGQCTAYNMRPSICRVFGASGFFDKNHKVSLSACKLIKETYPELLRKVSLGRTPENTPMITQWYARIQSLGTTELLERRPINEAILGALQLVGLYAQYQDFDV